MLILFRLPTRGGVVHPTPFPFPFPFCPFSHPSVYAGVPSDSRQHHMIWYAPGLPASRYRPASVLGLRFGYEPRASRYCLCCSRSSPGLTAFRYCHASLGLLRGSSVFRHEPRRSPASRYCPASPGLPASRYRPASVVGLLFGHEPRASRFVSAAPGLLRVSQLLVIVTLLRVSSVFGQMSPEDLNRLVIMILQVRTAQMWKNSVRSKAACMIYCILLCVWFCSSRYMLYVCT